MMLQKNMQRQRGFGPQPDPLSPVGELNTAGSEVSIRGGLH
jgi:hypothetical protein